jgi:lycopene cyclase domain-containing protein
VIYLAVLAGIFLASAWLEIVVRTRVFRRWRRLLLTLAFTIVPLVIWDWYAISEEHWHFHNMTGVELGILPLEELLFFIVVPIAGILSLEAVRAVRRWPAGDERP